MVLSLKNKLVIGALIFVGLLLLNCSREKETKIETAEKTDSISCAKPPINPNGDSELALLMRAMRDSTKSFKEMIMAGKVPAKFPDVFLKIHSAAPTDSETKKPSFDGFATAYLNSLTQLSKSKTSDAKLNYNAVVQACENCHSEHCPGPISTIRKLKLE
ncbi:MAG: hypothetical protein J0L69_02615 [Bacteroidetes bacterium]|nr:hypothetical protein [Bacteroidota bacterium]